MTCFAFAVIAGAVGVGAYSQRSDTVTVAVQDTDPTPDASADAGAPTDTTIAEIPSSSVETSTTAAIDTGAAPDSTTDSSADSTTADSSAESTSTTSTTLSTDTTLGTGSTTTTTLSTSASRIPVCPAIDGSSPRTMTFASPPPVCTDSRATYTALMETSEGTIRIALDSKNAPNTVNNFVFLSRYHFYDGLTIHRVVPGFIMQGGDPLANSNGGPGYKFADELPGKDGYDIGAVAMANSGVNSNGSQFFIVTGSTGKALNGTYSTFGKVTRGTSVMKAIDELGVDPGANGVEFPPKKTITILSMTITAVGERESRIPGYASTTSVSSTTTTVG